MVESIADPRRMGVPLIIVGIVSHLPGCSETQLAEMGGVRRSVDARQHRGAKL